MFFSVDIAIDNETLAALKLEAATMALKAEAAIGAYDSALKEHWMRLVRDKIGAFPKNAECVIDGESVLLVDFYASGGRVWVSYRRKTSKGGWGKTEMSMRLRYGSEMLFRAITSA